MEKDYEGFKRKAEEIGKKILTHNNPIIAHHLDCDGIAGGAAVSLAFKTIGKPFHMMMLKRLDNETIKTLPKADDYIFVDLGASQLDTLKTLSGKNVFIIDHHPPQGERGSVEMINCHDYGFDGATDASSASTAFWCFKHQENSLHYELGIVGAVGDMQDQEGLKALNAEMLKQAVEKQLVLKTTDLRMYGKVSRPLVSFLAFCTEPFLPGLTGNEKNCAIFLNENNIPTEKDNKKFCYYDLNVFDRKKLASCLIAYASEKLDEETANQLIGDTYLFLKEPQDSELRDAYEFSTMINACGRHDQAQTGVLVCMHHSQEALEKAKNLVAGHRMMISKGIAFAKKKGMDAGAFYFLDARGKISDTVIGTVAGSFYASGIISQNKPIIAFSEDEEKNVKASARATKKLVSQGLNLGDVMRKAGQAVGGLGGGHSIAAGASFKQNNQNISLFLKIVQKEIEKQLHNKP